MRCYEVLRGEEIRAILGSEGLLSGRARVVLVGDGYRRVLSDADVVAPNGPFLRVRIEDASRDGLEVGISTMFRAIEILQGCSSQSEDHAIFRRRSWRRVARRQIDPLYAPDKIAELQTIHAEILEKMEAMFPDFVLAIVPARVATCGASANSFGAIGLDDSRGRLQRAVNRYYGAPEHSRQLLVGDAILKGDLAAPSFESLLCHELAHYVAFKALGPAAAAVHTVQWALVAEILTVIFQGKAEYVHAHYAVGTGSSLISTFRGFLEGSRLSSLRDILKRNPSVATELLTTLMVRGC